LTVEYLLASLCFFADTGRMPSALRSPSLSVSQGPIIKPDTLAYCHQVIDSPVSQLAALAEQVAVLQERVALNSLNSSKPPSSDGPGGSGMNRAAAA
jgi:hypothetical protein